MNFIFQQEDINFLKFKFAFLIYNFHKHLFIQNFRDGNIRILKIRILIIIAFISLEYCFAKVLTVINK